MNESLVERLEALEKSASKFSDEYINNIDSRLKEFSGTNERLEKTIQMIGDNKTTLTRLIEKTDRHSDDIAFISRDFQDKLSDNSATQEALNKLSSEVRTEIEENRKSLEEKMEMLEEDQRVEREGTDQSLNKLLENVENIKNSLEDNLTDAKTARSDLSALTEDTRALERQMEETKEKMSGSAENLRNLESTVDSLESRHTETVTRMREVTVLTTEIEKYVKDMENKMITESENAFEKIAKDMDQLQDSFKDLNNFKTDTETNSGIVWSKLGDIESNLAAAKDHIGDEVDGKLASQNDELSSRLHQVDLDNKELREKVVLLEDGHNSLVSKLSLMETLGDRLNTVEMARQQSDAR